MSAPDRASGGAHHHHSPSSAPHAGATGGPAGDAEGESDARWAEELALRVLLARVAPERRDEAAERVRSVLRDFEDGGPAARRRLPRMLGIVRRRGGRGE